jgi:hypothetical protein
MARFFAMISATQQVSANGDSYAATIAWRGCAESE